MSNCGQEKCKQNLAAGCILVVVTFGSMDYTEERVNQQAGKWSLCK